MSELETLFNWYLEHQEALVATFDGRFIVIHANEVVGDFEAELEAYKFATEHYQPGEFMIQKVSPGTSSYTQTFHSRVVI
ncbi:MAG TPA: hypothetical protein VII60_01650 [Acidimicrobiales bacterium]